MYSLRKLMATLLSVTVVASAMSMNIVAADRDSVSVDEANFPDAIFRQYVMDNIDTNHDGKLSASERNIQEITLEFLQIDSIRGVEYFESLEKLNCGNNNIRTMDISHNTALTNLFCPNNKLIRLDVSRNTQLENITCSSNQLTDIDLSSNINLIMLDCSYNQLTSLDIGNNVNLGFLNCESNQLTELDLSSNNLASLDFSYNQITEIDLSTCTDLQSLYCRGNELTDLDISNNLSLCNLCCSGNRITELDITNNTNLGAVYCNDNPISSLDFSSVEYLSNFDISDTDIDVVDISGCSQYFLTAPEYSQVTNINDAIVYDSYSFDPTQILGYDHSDSAYAYIYVSSDGYSTNISAEFAFSGGQGFIVEPEGEPFYPVAPEDVKTNLPVYLFANRLYTCALNRDSEWAGRDWWARQLQNGVSGAEVAHGFLFSREVADSNLTDAEFIGRIYATLMDREPALEEVEYWVGTIADGGTRQSVFEGFINSSEWANICITYGIVSGGMGIPTIEVQPSEEIVAFATRLYTTCLNREADQAGLEWWAGELANQRVTGSAAAQSYFFSDEFINAGVDDREFVNRLYLTFMNRDAGDGEFDYWLGEMGNGMTRESVFGGFAGSEEFGNICAEFGIIR